MACSPAFFVFVFTVAHSCLRVNNRSLWRSLEPWQQSDLHLLRRILWHSHRGSLEVFLIQTLWNRSRTRSEPPHPLRTFTVGGWCSGRKQKGSSRQSFSIPQSELNSSAPRLRGWLFPLMPTDVQDFRRAQIHTHLIAHVFFTSVWTTDQISRKTGFRWKYLTRRRHAHLTHRRDLLPCVKPLNQLHGSCFPRGLVIILSAVWTQRVLLPACCHVTHWLQQR